MKYLTLLLTLLPVIALVVTDYKTKAEDIIVSDVNESGEHTFISGDNLPEPTFREIPTQSGMDGILNCTISEGCEWILMAPTGYVIDIDVETFQFSGCTNDSVYVGDGTFEYSVPIGTYDCDNAPTLVRSNSNAVFVRFYRSTPTNQFYATWKALPAPDCCSRIFVSASSSALISTYSRYNHFLGEYFTTDETTTGADGEVFLVHRRVDYDEFWLAHDNLDTIAPWIMSEVNQTSPGSGNGYMFYGLRVRCAEHIALKFAYNQVANAVQPELEEIKFDCATPCPSSGPTGPSGTSSDFDGTNTFNTIVTLTCMSNDTTKFYSKCQSDGAWSSISGECPKEEEVMAIAGSNTMDENSTCAYLTSPNWPSKYDPNSLTSWIFRSQVSGSCSSPKLEVKFTEPFKIIGRLNCKRQDRLIIYRKHGKTRRLCNYFVKSAVPSTRAYNFIKSNYVAFTFISDKRKSAAGFKATVCVRCS